MTNVKISFSALTAYWRCPMYFKRKYIDGLSPPAKGEKNHLSFGTLIHKGLELYHQGTPMKEVLNVGLKLYEQYELNKLPDFEQYSFRHFEKLLTAYSLYWDDSDLELIHAEQSFEVPVNDMISLIGTYDGIARRKSTGDFLLLEHKTASSLGKQFSTMAEMSNQKVGYCVGARMLGMEVYDVMYNGLQTLTPKLDKWIATSDAKHLPFQREYVSVTNQEIERFLNDVILTVDDILRDVRTGYFLQKRHDACTAYGGCEFKNACLYPDVDHSNDFVVNDTKRFICERNDDENV